MCDDLESGLTTHSTRPPSACLASTFFGFIRVVDIVGRRVNSGVSPLIQSYVNGPGRAHQTEKRKMPIRQMPYPLQSNTVNRSCASLRGTHKSNKRARGVPSRHICFDSCPTTNAHEHANTFALMLASMEVDKWPREQLV